MRRIIFGLLMISLMNLEVNGQLPFSISDVWSVIKWCDSIVNSGVAYYSAKDLLTDSSGKEFATIFNEIGKVSRQLESFASMINQKLDGILHTFLNNLRDNIILQFGKTQLNDLFNTIDRLHNKAMTLRINKQFGKYILTNFVKLILWDSNSVPETLEKINQIMLPSNHYVVPPFIQLMLKDAQENLQYDCNQYMSAQQKIYYVYSHLILSEMQGLATLSYAYSIQQILDKSYNYIIELENSKKIFRKRVKDYYKNLSVIMALFPREIHRCDVNPSKVGVDFIELYRFSRATLFTTQNLTSGLKIDRSRVGNCRLSCNEINESTLGYDAKNSGTTIYNCQYVGGPVKACVLDMPSHREYSWWEYKEGIYGHYKPCNNEKDLSGFVEDTSYLGVPTDIKTCQTCVCSVDINSIENHNIGEPFLTSISISPQMSDISNNMIVTGVKFSVHINAIYIQIQENKFTSSGIAMGNSSWKKLNYNYNKFEYADFNHEWKTVNLDDMILPDNYVVTGVKFGRENRTSSFQLEVHGTPFNFNTGLLDLNGSKWFTNDDISNKNSGISLRKEIEINAPDDPTRCSIYDYDKETHKSIKFMHTDIRKDAGLHTVPYFDTQTVDTQPPFPLSGIGLFHRGRDGYGGYIAPRLFTIEISQNIKTTLNKVKKKSSKAQIHHIR